MLQLRIQEIMLPVIMSLRYVRVLERLVEVRNGMMIVEVM
jgi:hypothetical protein